MQLINELDKISYHPETVLTVGTYDGIHAGHLHVLDHLFENAAADNARTVLLTFNPHPQHVLNPKMKPGLLTSIEEKSDILAETSLDILLAIPFDARFASMKPENFIESVCVERIGMSKIVIGFNHAFGKNRKGENELLLKLGKKFGFKIINVDPFIIDGNIVSSTNIRNAVMDGNIEKANTMLSRPYSITGTVEQGHGRGSRLGFPTANIQLSDPDKLLPKDGVYAVKTLIDNEIFKGMAYIGTKPTFADNNRTCEINIHAFNKSIYGKTIKAAFYSYIRNEQKFDSGEELISKIKEDQKKSLELLS